MNIDKTLNKNISYNNHKYKISNLAKRLTNRCDVLQGNQKVITQRTLYYVDQLGCHNNFNFFMSWNWGAALFPISWLFYRKLYLIAIAATIAEIVLTNLLKLILPYSKYANYYSTFFLKFFLLGILGNYILLKHILHNQSQSAPLEAENVNVWLGIAVFISLQIINLYLF